MDVDKDWGYLFCFFCTNAFVWSTGFIFLSGLESIFSFCFSLRNECNRVGHAENLNLNLNKFEKCFILAFVNFCLCFIIYIHNTHKDMNISFNHKGGCVGRG